MSLNLVRNSKVFFTTNVDSTTGKVNAASTAAYTSSNTFELLVLDGFTFSQNVNNETVTVSEAGSAPTRGQRNFTTSLAPVDFSMSTYIRPSQLAGSPFTIQCDESVLWNALFSDTAIATGSATATTVGVSYSTSTGQLTFTATGTLTYTGSYTSLPAVGDMVNIGGLTTNATGTTLTDEVKKLNGIGRVVTSSSTSLVVALLDPLRTTSSTISLATANTFNITKSAWQADLAANSDVAVSGASTGMSEKNQLQKFGLLFLIDNVLYAVDNCALNQVTIDFGLDQIATAQWSGQATAIRELSRAVKASGGTFSGGTTSDVGSSGAYQAANNSANYITNKLSTATLKALKAIGTSISANDSYIIPLTGGSITINNNISYITPATLGIVNTPITYYTGVRAITGTMNAYLRTPSSGTTNTGELFKDMVTEAGLGTAAIIEPMFELGIQIGGSSNIVRVDLDMPTVSLTVPALSVEQIVSVAINFTAQGYTYNSTQANQSFDVTQPNELTVRYYS